MTYEECKPTWEVAMLVHSNALGNPDAPYNTKKGAQEEIVRAGKLVDTMQGDISDLLERLRPYLDGCKTDRELLRDSLRDILSSTYKRKEERA